MPFDKESWQKRGAAGQRYWGDTEKTGEKKETTLKAKGGRHVWGGGVEKKKKV